MVNYVKNTGYHLAQDIRLVWPIYRWRSDTKFHYDFRNFFHPYTDDLLQVVRRTGLDGLLAPQTQQLSAEFFSSSYTVPPNQLVDTVGHPKDIDTSVGGPYSTYNWEMFFHMPVTVAVHLSKTQRFAEAQQWFHYVFDPTSTENLPAPERYWRFKEFRSSSTPHNIRDLLTLLSTPDAELDATQLAKKAQVLDGYEAMKHKPFHPHAVARTRPLSYQYYVVMKYLDNLIDWGDSLFLQDTIESINEATQRYVLAANLLGPRPQRVPEVGRTRTQTYAQLKASLDETGNALVALEGEFPFNLASPQAAPGDGDAASPLFGIGRTLYFCVPNNDRLMTYWDTVADRLYKIRHCMNISGVVRQLALFDPPLDPGMLVKAAAAGIDVGSILAGTGQPAGPLRALPLIQKSLELANEVRTMGGALLASLERQDGEQLALMRQAHELSISQLAKDTRFLQLQQAKEATESLLRSRESAWERYSYYLQLQGLAPDSTLAPERPALTRTRLTAETFDDVYAALVEQYDQPIPQQPYPNMKAASGGSPSAQAGATGTGALFLNDSEASELNDHLPAARDFRLAGSVTDTVASVLTFIPEFNVNLHFWGMGGSSKLFGGSKLSDAAKIAGEILKTISAYHSDQAGIAGRTAGHQRRADEWVHQANLAARELAHNGRQLIASLIAEQVSEHELASVRTQIDNSTEVADYLHSKFTNLELHTWMSGETSRLYYQWYRFASDMARKAETTMKSELRRPELDDVDFISFNYWDAGRKGLVAGEALHADVRRMEVAWHENNRRELELVRHVSLRQLDPLALLRLKATGTAQFTIPEWLFDRDYPGHYLRRLKQVSVSVPAVAGPFTPVPAQLSLQRSTVRVSPLLADDTTYARTGAEDPRFSDSYGPIEQIATSTGSQDAGLFEPGAHDERLLPFENAGAISTWQVDLPRVLRGFDYSTISDVVLHLRYTARQGGDRLGNQAVQELEDTMADVAGSGLALLLSLRYDFPTEWAAFTNGNQDLRLDLTRTLFPYLAQGRDLSMAADLEFYAATESTLTRRMVPVPAGTADALSNGAAAPVTIAPDATVLRRDADEVFVIVHYGLGAA